MNTTQGNRQFTEQLLKYKYGGTPVNKQSGAINGLNLTLSIPRQANENFYAVTSPNCLIPTSNAFSVFAYSPGKESAAIAYKGDYRTFVLGFPFESIQSEAQRATVMASILQFFGK